MAIQLSRDTIKKLTHDSLEVRLASLDQIEAKLFRAFAHNDTVEFCPVELCKQLIRWFGYQPLQSSVKVLELIKHLLQSRQYRKIVQQLGLKRFQHEIGKVQKLLRGRAEEQKLIDEIQSLLVGYAHESELESLMLEGLDQLSLQENSSDLTDSRSNAISELDILQLFNAAEDTEMIWSRPCLSDYNAMKSLADTLRQSTNKNRELSAALEHLQISMLDYPAEFMLQSPHILLHLLQLCDNLLQAKTTLEDVLSVLGSFLRNLTLRLKERCKCLAYALPSLETVTSHKMQLKVGKALDLIMQTLINQLDLNIADCCNESMMLLQLLHETLAIYAQQELIVPAVHLQKLALIAQTLWQSCEEQEHFTLHRISQLIVNFLLMDMAQNNAQYAVFKDGSLLEPLLQDYSFQQNFPARHECLRQLLFKADVDCSLKQKYATLKKYDEALQLCANILRDSMMSVTTLSNDYLIEQSHMIVPLLEQLQSNKLLERLFDAIVGCNGQYVAAVALRKQAEELLLQLLQLRSESMQLYTFSKVAHAIKKHLACLMNTEIYCNGVSNIKLLEAQIIGVPLSTTLFLLLLQESRNNSNATVRTLCEELLIIILKSQHLLATNWKQLQKMLEPVMPLLQCLGNSEQLMQLLLKLYDPDADHVSCLSIFRGNITFLFHENNQLRSEALSRIMYIMSVVPYSQQYLPNLDYVKNAISNDICLLEVPRNIKEIFCNPSTERPSADMISTLNNLLCLLDSADVEPLVRRTTLLQLNVLCQNWQLTGILCEEGGFYLILKSLESALEQLAARNYTDSVIPAISIICKILFYDNEICCQLSELANLYILLLRALFLFPLDIQLRQDTTVCLFQLLYAKYIKATAKSVQAPNLLQNIVAPLKCEYSAQFLETTTCRYNLSSIFNNAALEQLYVRQLLASKCCSNAHGQLSQIDKQYLEKQCDWDFGSDLLLTPRDYRLIKASAPKLNIKRCLKAIGNATEHHMLINALTTLKLQLLQQKFEKVLFIEQAHAQQLHKMLGKYLQLPPGNQYDFLLYEHLLEVWQLCVQLRLEPITSGIARILQTDFQSTLITLLQQVQTPLRFYDKLCQLLSQLLRTKQIFEKTTTTDASIFYSNLFELLFLVVKQLFKNRDLLRVRCILMLLQQLSEFNLHMPDNTLHSFGKRALHLLAGIKSLTYTGSQLQRDCLLLLLQLQKQMTSAQQMNFWLQDNSVKYVSSLCSHNDGQVRALAWCLLNAIAHCRNDEQTGSQLLLSELRFFPHGFLACCLSSFLDDNEVLLVRQLAGELFVQLMHDFDASQQLLQLHGFLQSANTSLHSNMMLQTNLPLRFDFVTSGVLVSCEIISVYCRICIKLLQMDMQYLEKLGQSSFMLKLYELLKMPLDPADHHAAYYSMCADICHLYGLCNGSNAAFMQRQLSRDQIWLQSFCQLLKPPQKVSETSLHNILQLLLQLLKDDAAYAQLCLHFSTQYQNIISCLHGCFSLTLLNTPVQRCAFAVLSFLLIKSQTTSCIEEQQQQPEVHRTFAPILDKVIDVSIMEMQQQEETGSITGGQLIFIQLQRLFVYVNCNSSNSKFDTAPNSNQMRIAETIALLLKLCVSAQQAAKNLKFLDETLRMLHEFFNHFKFNCTSTFVRRYGEKKKMAIICNFHMYYSVLFHWYSAPAAISCDELQAIQFSQLLIQTWSWLAYHAELKLLILKLCAVLSEHSMPICQQFSTITANHSHSVLQLVTTVVIAETQKVRPVNADDLAIIQTGIRVIINCCAAAEGRIALLKCHILDVFDCLHPFNPKNAKTKLNVLQLWLQFWEVFTRYAECAQARNLSALCAFTNRLAVRSELRLLCLKILRNMCFQSANRNALLASNDFICTVNDVICQELLYSQADLTSYEEQMLISVGIWKLISSGAKYVAVLRGTKLANKFQKLRQQLQCLNEADDVRFRELPFAQDLSVVLDIIFNILNE